VEDEVLRFGTLIHKGLEAWWKAPPAERLEAALAAIQPKHLNGTALATASV
jgi:hypothetical protein